MPFAELAAALAGLEQQGLRRERRVLESPQGARVAVDGREYVAYCSNDYLGLAAHPALVAAACEGAERYGVGAGASHLILGHGAAHHALEERLAAFVELPRALLFSTGYLANLGIVTALAGRGDSVFADRLNHASLNDAALLSRAQFSRYPHLDLDALARLLAGSRARRKLIVTDAVFSMDGDIAPVRELLALAERHDAWLLLDDAHGFGVLGRSGRGAPSHFGVRSPRLVYMATLGKAAGVCGAFVAGAPEVVETLVQRARPYVYTTASPPLLAVALMKSLELLESQEWRRERLRDLVALLRERLRLARWRLAPSETAIQPLVIGSSAEAMAVSEALARQGLLVPAIRPPTVPQGTARLRISLSAAHEIEDVERLAAALNDVENKIEPPRRKKFNNEKNLGGEYSCGFNMNEVRDVVLLHGWGMNAAVWRELAALLPQYRLHACNLPGYGATPACMPYTLAAVAAEVARTAPARCQVVGWSLGGLVALAWARAAPEQAVRLALIATTPAFVQRDGWPHAMTGDVLATFSATLAAGRASALQRFIALQASGDDNARQVVRRLRAALAAEDEPDSVALAGGLGILLETDLRDGLSEVRQPALVVHGSRDGLVPSAAAGHLSRGLPAARLTLLDGAAHAPFVSRPRQVAAVLREFLDG